MYKWLGKCPVTVYNINMPVFKSVNKDFFKKWSRDMAYVLGFFAADGYITVNKRGGQFWCMDITDKIIIQTIKKKIESDHKISVRKRRGKHISYRLQIGSIEMCDDLRRLGYDERKTKSLAVPNIPEKYFSDFVRGYFDGDGHMWVGYIHKERKTKTLVIQTGFTSCSNEFLEILRKRLEHFSILKGVIKQGNGNCYRLTFSVNNTLNLYKFMYNAECIKSKLFLGRKKIIFERFIKNKYENATVAQR